MSLRPDPMGPVPEETVRVARAVFRKGNLYLRLRETLGTIYADDLFTDLFSTTGRPAEAPWRLALVCVLQFLEDLSDRQSSEAVRARIDWKYLLGLELTDPGCDFSVLSEFRDRLVRREAGARLFKRLIEKLSEGGWIKKRGVQRTDSTHVLAAVRRLNRVDARIGIAMSCAMVVASRIMNGGKLSHKVSSTSKRVCDKPREVLGERCARVLALSMTSNLIVFVFGTIARLFWQRLKRNGWLLADRDYFPDAKNRQGKGSVGAVVSQRVNAIVR